MLTFLMRGEYAKKGRWNFGYTDLEIPGVCDETMALGIV